MPSPVTQSIGIASPQHIPPPTPAFQLAEAVKQAGVTNPQIAAQAQASATTAQSDSKRAVSPGRERVDGLFSTQRRPDDEEDDDREPSNKALAQERGKGGRLSTVG